MFPKVKNILLVATLLVAVILSYGCQSDDASYVVVEDEALGTFVQVKCKTNLQPGVLAEEIGKIDQSAKSSMSIFDSSSLLSRLNDNTADNVDSHISRNLEVAERFFELSDGVYDVTVKPLTEAWGFAGRDATTQPNVDSLLQFVGFDKISILGNRLVKEDYRVQLDLNSLAKGYVVDLVAEMLEERGISDYMVNIGGEIRCRGNNPDNKAWSIGIETPYDGNMSMDSFEKIIQVKDCAVATSGNYRRFYIDAEGRKVAHTIDPRTGYSVVSNLLSATVVAPTCIEADAAATMFMAMGSEGGALELAKRCEAEYGWGYYFIYANEDGYRIECSPRFRD